MTGELGDAPATATAAEVAARADLRRQVIQVDQLKNDFLSVAQHQLRTPLSGIKWALESIAGDPGLSAEKEVESMVCAMSDELTKKINIMIYPIIFIVFL